MKRAILVVSSLALAIALAPGTAVGQTADAPEGVIHDAESAMAFLKTLTGDWVNANQGTEHGTTKARYLQRRQDRHHPDRQAVDDEEKQSQGQEGQGEREHDHDRPNDRVDQP